MDITCSRSELVLERPRVKFESVTFWFSYLFSSYLSIYILNLFISPALKFRTLEGSLQGKRISERARIKALFLWVLYYTYFLSGCARTYFVCIYLSILWSFLFPLVVFYPPVVIPPRLCVTKKRHALRRVSSFSRIFALPIYTTFDLFYGTWYLCLYCQKCIATG